MSIATVGPAAYDEQYRITVLLALISIKDKTAATLRVETALGEDAELSYRASFGPRTLDVQVKTQSADLNWTVLSEVLAHFEPHDSKHCALSRLEADSNLSLLLVYAGRALDDLRRFLAVLESLDPAIPFVLSHAALDTLGAALRTVYPKKGTKLAVGRHTTCHRLANDLHAQTATSVAALDRVLVWEQCHDALIRERIEARLLRDFRIPRVNAHRVLSLLTDEIRRARDGGHDALPGIQKILSDHSVARMRMPGLHVDREDETAWLARLKSKHHLALAGHSKCGKTHLAREVLDRLQLESWHCEDLTDVDAAIRFLQADDPQERACLIDDPLLGTNTERALKRLADLPNWCRSDRVAIVTSANSTLRRFQSSFIAGRTSVAGLFWHDCTVVNRAYLGSLWDEFCRTAGVAQAIHDPISELLATMPVTELLQPGQLRHLARRDPTELQGLTPAELVAIARFTDETILIELRADAATVPLAVVLAVSCSGLQGATEIDLAFVISASEARPTFSENNGIVDFGGVQKVSPTFPSHPQVISLNEHRPVLERWRTRGYLLLEGKHWRFSHPDYQEAFTRLALSQLQSHRDGRQHLERALSALNPTACITAADLLERLWTDADADLTDWIRDLLIRALRETIFPVVQQRVLSILLSDLDRIPPPDLSQVMQLAVVQFPSDSDLMWEADTPWIFRGSDAGFTERWHRAHRLPTPEEFSRLLVRVIDSPVPGGVPARFLDQVTTYCLDHDEIALDPVALARIGRSENSFIRADIARLLCDGRLPFGPEAIVYLDDDDPRVPAFAIESSIVHWQRHVAAGKSGEVAKAIEQALKSFPVAVIASRFLYDLGDHYSERIHVPWIKFSADEANDLWENWAKWMCTIFPTVAPHAIHFKDGDLWTSLKKSLEHVSAPVLVNLFGAWIAFIEKRGQVSGLSDHTYGVTDLIFDSSRPFTPAQREPLLQRILNVTHTSPVIDNLGTLVELWDDLSISERALVTGLLSSQRGDLHWLKAATLVRDCPPELQVIAGNRANFYSQTATEAVASLSPSVLRAALAILARNTPGTANLYIRSHREFWAAIGDLMMQDWSHPDQGLMAFHLLVRFDSENEDTGPLLTRWQHLCQLASRDQRRRLFEILFEVGTEAPHVELPEVGGILFAVCETGEPADLIAYVLPNINLIETGSRSLSAFWGTEWTKILLSLVPSDKSIGAFVQAFASYIRDPKNPPIDGLGATAEKYFEAFYRTAPPRLLISHDNALGFLQRVGSRKSKTYKFIEEVRHDSFNYERRSLRSFRLPIWRDGWI